MENAFENLPTLEPPLESFDGAFELRRCPVLTLLTHAQFQRIGERFALTSIRKPLELSRISPDFSRPGQVLGQPLNDAFISRSPMKIQVTETEITIDPQQSATQLKVNGQELRSATRYPISCLEQGLILDLANRVALLLGWGACEASAEGGLGLIGHGLGMERVREEITRLAGLDVPILIRGETGTGKELVAQAIVAHSMRRGKPFIALNMAALAPSLATAELFGASKGAFTGAVSQQRGYFRSAHEGTLFMDEVGETTSEVQTMLLRALETGEIYPVGSQTPIRVDVRVLAATDANLEQAAMTGGFKSPLLHRLAGAVIQLPPLRERPEDICRLLAHFAINDQPSSLDNTSPPWLPVSLVSQLLRYAWPGNVRQLRNVVRQLVIASQGQRQLRLTEELRQLLTKPPAPLSERERANEAESPAQSGRKPSEINMAELLGALSEGAWCLKNAAEYLGIARPSIYRLLDAHAGKRGVAELSDQEIRTCREACKGDLEAMARRLLVDHEALRHLIREDARFWQSDERYT